MIRKSNCKSCGLMFTEADKNWDIARETKKCPRCKNPLNEFQILDGQEIESFESSYQNNPLATENLRPTSIVFWRHIVASCLIAFASPPYATARFSEFLGYGLGKIFIAIGLSVAVTFLGWLFYTDYFRGRVSDTFVKGVWAFLLIVIFFLNYSRIREFAFIY